MVNHLLSTTMLVRDRRRLTTQASGSQSGAISTELWSLRIERCPGSGDVDGVSGALALQGQPST